MSTRAQDFLQVVLGADGAGAIQRAVTSAPALEALLLPRAVLAWLRATPSYQGELPGGSEHAEFAKTESGFTGAVALGDDLHRFQDVSIFRVAAVMTVALGADHVFHDGALSVSPARTRDLGKSLDVLVKRLPQLDRALARSRRGKKAEPVGAELEKKVAAAGSGTAAVAIPPVAPEAPIARAPPPSAKPQPAPTKPKVPTVKLTRSEAATPCPTCAQPQMSGDKFTGCRCMADLAKSAQVVSADASHVVLRLTGWDSDGVVTFLEAVGRLT